MGKFWLEGLGMDSKSISIFNVRLLELEEKLDAFRSLQEDELSEIKSALVQIRQDLQLYTYSNADIQTSSTHDENKKIIKDDDESSDDLQILAL